MPVNEAKKSEPLGCLRTFTAPATGWTRRRRGLVINLSLPRESGVLNYETAISDCPDRTYVLKGSYAVLHRESNVV